MAQTVAGRVERDGLGPRRFESFQSEIVDEELCELANPCGDPSVCGEERIVTVEEVLIVVDDHRSTRSGRDDDRPICGVEHRDRVLRHSSGLGEVAGVECRLTAARLVLWKLDRYAPCFQHVDDRPADLRVEGIDDAGNKQLRAVGCAHVGQR